MGLFGKSSKVKPARPVSHDVAGERTLVADANARLMAEGKLYYLKGVRGYCLAAKVFLTQEWMLLSDQVPTTELKSTLADSIANTAVVNALLFTMVSVTPGNVGDELEELSNGKITVETSNRVYTFLSWCSFFCLLCGVLLSLTFYQMVGECNNHDEVVFWSHSMGMQLNVPYFLLLVGMLFYLLSQFWLTLSWLPIAWLGGTLGIVFVVALVCLHLTNTATISLYSAKCKVAEGMRAENYSEKDEVQDQQKGAEKVQDLVQEG